MDPSLLNRYEIDSLARSVCGQKVKLSSRLKKIGSKVSFLVFPIIRAAGIETAILPQSEKRPKFIKRNLELLLGRDLVRLIVKRVNKIAASSL